MSKTGVFRVVEAENALVGRGMNEAIDEAAELAYKSARPIHKMGGTPLYKKDLVRTLTRRALTEVLNKVRQG